MNRTHMLNLGSGMPWTPLLVALLFFEPTIGAGQAKSCVRNAGGTKWTVNGVVAGGVASTKCSQGAGAWSRVAPYDLVVNTHPDSLPTGNVSAGGTISFTSTPDGHLFIGFVLSHDHDLSNFDQVFLFFDRNNNGDVWENGDFYIQVTVGPLTPIQTPADPNVSGSNDCQLSATVAVFTRSGQSWQANGGLAGSVVAAVAYDYNQVAPDDAEHDLWNLEIDMTVAPFGIATDQFAMGAYVFLDDGHLPNGQVGNVLRWPASMGQRTMDMTDFGIYPIADASALTEMSFNDVCFDVKFAASPNTSNSMTEVNATGPTTFKVWYYVEGPGTGQTTGKDSGDIRLVVYRYSSGEWPAIFDKTTFEKTTWYNGPPHSVALTMTNPPPADVDFCSDVYIGSNWPLDDDRSYASNHHHVNYIPFGTSEVTKELDLGTQSDPSLASVGVKSLLLHIYTSNDPGSKPLGMGKTTGSERSPVPTLLIGSVAIVIAGIARRRKVMAIVCVATGAIALLEACPRPGRQGPIGTDRWTLENADQLGLTPVEGRPGWYRMPARLGESKRARFHFTGRPLPYRTITDSLPMHADTTGRPIMKRLAAHAGQIVSVFALGKVDVDGPDGPLPPTDANGLIRQPQQQLTTAVAAGTTYPLGRGQYVPNENIGTLVGSFDGFKTSFLIGTNASFVVPRGAEQLTIAVNGTAADYRRAVGDYIIKWFVTQTPTVPTAMQSGMDTPTDKPHYVYGWDVLSTVNVFLYYEHEIVRPKTHLKQTGVGNLGEAHLSIYETHVN